MAKGKLTFNDLREGIAAARHYGLSTHQTEQQIRKHLDGASTQEIRKVYKEFYHEKREPSKNQNQK